MNTESEMTLAEAFRSIADLLDAQPVLADHVIAPSLDVWAETPEEFAELAQALGGRREKRSGTMLLTVERTFGRVSLKVCGYHEQVCEAKVVGTETVEIPAVEASPARTETRDVVEWVCPPVLGEAS